MTLDRVTFMDVEFELNQDDSRPPFFVLGIRKSGSSIFNSIAAALAEPNGYKFIDVAGRLFERGVAVSEWQDNAELSMIVRPGNLYGGFRNAPKGLYSHPGFKNLRKALLVRDPRDALVSEYFSNAYSHSVPNAGSARDEMLKLRSSARSSDIQEYALSMAPALRKTMREYIMLTRKMECKVFRYEDVIFEKAEWMRSLSAYFGWTNTPSLINGIMSWADVRPQQERPQEFIRRVSPGDHLIKFHPDVGSRLSQIFVDELAYFGYESAARL